MRIDIRDQVWQVVVTYAAQRITKLQTVLERPNTDWERTIGIRAEIKALRALLALPEELANGNVSLDTD